MNNLVQIVGINNNNDIGNNNIGNNNKIYGNCVNTCSVERKTELYPCKNCKTLVCGSCIKIDMTKCIFCISNNNDNGGGDDGNNNEYYRHICYACDKLLVVFANKKKLSHQQFNIANPSKSNCFIFYKNLSLKSCASCNNLVCKKKTREIF